MEFQNNLNLLADKIVQMKDQIGTEEATKTAFVLPFLNILGYDVFNPTEVIPEFTADVGLKKGEKVDYAIFQNGNPILIIECKHWKESLDIHDSQLIRYFHVTKTRFALLTNGIEYRFYTDLDSSNVMDEKPFLEVSLLNIKEHSINELLKFHKSNFDVDSILNSASSLKYTKEIRKILTKEFQDPSAEFVRFFTSKIYQGRITDKVLEQFTELVHRSTLQFTNDKVNDRLTIALTKDKEIVNEEEFLIDETKSSNIVTTEEELDSFRVVQAILRRTVDVSRIFYRDAQSYFSIILDDNNRKPICRLHLNGGKKYIGLFDESKKETKHLIESVDDIFNFENELIQIVQSY